MAPLSKPKYQGKHSQPQQRPVSPEAAVPSERPSRPGGHYLPFLALLYALTLVSFLIPLRPTQSVGEKRELARFPSFSVQRLGSGEYFDDITLWFSDTFPGREGWVSLSNSVDGLHGFGSYMVDYSMLTAAQSAAVTQPEAEPAVIAEAAQEPAAQPTQEPEPTPAGQPVGQWAGIGEGGSEEAIYGSVLQIKGKVFNYYMFYPEGADRHIALVNRAVPALRERGVAFYDVLVPSGAGVLLASSVLEKFNCSSPGEAISYFFENEDDYITKVNVFNTLVEHNDEYIYYNTDHHWSALGAYYAYAEFCRAAGMEPTELSDYEKLDMGEFLGTLYFRAPKPDKLTLDDLYAYYPPGDLTVMIPELSLSEMDIIMDTSAMNESMKYNSFIYGDNPLVHICNNDLPDAPNCVMVKDSFGNPFAVYLSQHYHNVYVLDYRSYGGMDLEDFIDTYDIDDFILLENLGLAQEGSTECLSWFMPDGE